MRQKIGLIVSGMMFFFPALDAHAQEFVISGEQFVASGTLGGSAKYGRSVHAECDAAGNLHMIWIRNNEIHYKKRLVSGSWTAEETVPDSGSPNLYHGPRIAASAGGEVHVVWNGPHPQWNTLYYAMRSTTGWQPRQTLVYNPDGQHASLPVITVAPDGRVHVLFMRWTPTAHSWHHIIKTGSSWSSEMTMNSWIAELQELTHDDSGKLYQGCKGTAGGYSRAAYQIWDGSWGPIYRPADSIDHWVGDTDIAPGPDSALAIACTAYNHEGDYWFPVGVYTVTIGESPIKLTQAARMTDTTRVPEPRPQIGFDLLGNQYIVWTDGDHLRYAIRREDGTWYIKDALFPVGGGNQYFPELTVYGNTIYVPWEDSRGGIYYSTIVPRTDLPPEKATDPDPDNESTEVALSVDLNWAAGQWATAHDVYFGPTSPPPFQRNQTETTYTAADLDICTDYYWRIDEVNEYGTTTGDLWSFTTGSVPGDYDCDADVDQEDFGHFQACYTGPGIIYEAGCEKADFDGDGDVDLDDFGEFQACMGGANVPADPDCAD